jgi:hypothetical protein
VGAPGGGDLIQPPGAGRNEGAKTATVEVFEAPQPAQAAPEVLETKSLAVLPDLPKPANPDVVEAKAVAAEDRKPDGRESAKRLVAKRDAAVKKAKGEAKASARSEGKSKATPAAIKTTAGKTAARKTAARKTAAGKTAEKTAARKTAANKSKGGR